MSARPRPVTATITKPPWMSVPDADAAMYRRRSSLSSNGSTASLTSVLDHDSYTSEPEFEEEPINEGPFSGDGGDAKNIKTAVRFTSQPSQPRKLVRHTAETALVEDSSNLRRSNSSESGLSAWEIWLIQKAKDERKLRRQARQQRKQEKLDQMAKEREKQMKEQKAEETRKEWVRDKNMQEKLKKKMEKLKLDGEKRLKEEKEQHVRHKADSVFSEWLETKRQEEKDRKQREKERKQKEEELRAEKQKQAEEVYQKWLRRNKARPQSAPTERTGYNNNAPYPRPAYVNPVPWKHPDIPKAKQEKRPRKSRPRKYVWNPDKYF